MKTLLLTLLLITSAAQAEQWLLNGRTYNGTFHKFSADRTMVYVTSDRDSYKGSWIKVAALDPATRVRLRVATPQEQATVQAQRERNRQLEAQALAQMEQNRQLDLQALAQIQMEQRRLLQAQAQAPANVGYTASLAEHQLNLQRAQDARRQASAYRRSYPQTYGAPYYSHRYYPSSPYVHVPYVHVPHVHVPYIHVPQPIIIRTY
ncbi:MAG: hypothetical protein ACYC67_23905 [Prosthecobacter sp.]